MEKELQTAPKLRFKGYTDDWQQQKFSKIALRNNKITNTPNLPAVTYDDIVSNKGILNKEIKELQKGKKGIFFDKNYILYGKLRPYLHNYMVPNFKGSAVGDFWVFKSSYNTPYFLYYLIQTERYNYISNLSIGSKMPRADWNLVSNSKFSIPIYKMEQERIGGLLLKVDDTITLLQQRNIRLNSLKKRLNQYFFKDNYMEKFPKESISSLGYIYSGLSGKTKKDFNHGTGHYITYININRNLVSNIEGINAIELDNKQNLVKKGDILFTLSSETPEEVGLASVWLYDLPNTYLNSFSFGFRPNNQILDSLYLGYLFRSDYFRRKSFPLAQGISRYNLAKKSFLNLSIPIPPLKVQQQIAHILYKIDNLIIENDNSISALCKLKQFLLQNMFI